MMAPLIAIDELTASVLQQRRPDVGAIVSVIVSRQSVIDVLGACADYLRLVPQTDDAGKLLEASVNAALAFEARR